MGITAADIDKVNKEMNYMPVKGKNYAVVAERVKAFRIICPDGGISTELVSKEKDADGKETVTMRAIVTDGNKVLATGFAQEKQDDGLVNKTSWLENCETSAVGRALAFLGLGINENIASAEETTAAMIGQLEYIGAKEKKVLENMCKDRNLNLETTFPQGLNLTGEQYIKAVETLSKIEVHKK